MRRGLTAIIVCAAVHLAEPAAAQSMNIRAIVATAMDEICGPFARSGDHSAAVRAAVAADYRAPSGLDPARPPALVLLNGDAHHIGRIVLINSVEQVCSVDMAEAGVTQVSDRAAEALTALGMRRVLAHGDATLGVVVWAGEGRQAVIAPSNLSSGASITLSWRRPD